jgi:hypothetical protein
MNLEGGKGKINFKFQLRTGIKTRYIYNKLSSGMTTRLPQVYLLPFHHHSFASLLVTIVFDTMRDQ